MPRKIESIPVLGNLNKPFFKGCAGSIFLFTDRLNVHRIGIIERATMIGTEVCFSMHPYIVRHVESSDWLTVAGTFTFLCDVESYTASHAKKGFWKFVDERHYFPPFTLIIEAPVRKGPFVQQSLKKFSRYLK